MPLKRLRCVYTVVFISFDLSSKFEVITSINTKFIKKINKIFNLKFVQTFFNEITKKSKIIRPPNNFPFLRATSIAVCLNFATHAPAKRSFALIK